MEFSYVSLFGYLALFSVLLNFSMYFIFHAIKKSKNKQLRKKLALIARKWMKTHRPVAVVAALFIFNHAMSAILQPFSINIQFLSGLTASVFFLALLISGIIRNQKATGCRRRAHFTMAVIFIISMILHIFTTIY